MRIELSNGRNIRLIFNRDPHPTTRKERRKHRATRVTIAEEMGNLSRILSFAEVKAHPPDVFTREIGRQEALRKALHLALTNGQLNGQEAVVILHSYDNRPRPKTTLSRRERLCASFRVMEQARREATRTSAA